jgi:hypothetical protein
MAALKDPARVSGGRKAAKTAKKRYGGDYHRAIGALGGRCTASRHGSEHFEVIGAWAVNIEGPIG